MAEKENPMDKIFAEMKANNGFPNLNDIGSEAWHAHRKIEIERDNRSLQEMIDRSLLHSYDRSDMPDIEGDLSGLFRRSGRIVIFSVLLVISSVLLNFNHYVFYIAPGEGLGPIYQADGLYYEFFAFSFFAWVSSIAINSKRDKHTKMSGSTETYFGLVVVAFITSDVLLVISIYKGVIYRDGTWIDHTHFAKYTDLFTVTWLFLISVPIFIFFVWRYLKSRRTDDHNERNKLDKVTQDHL